jgi:hypothetical protein
MISKKITAFQNRWNLEKICNKHIDQYHQNVTKKLRSKSHCPPIFDEKLSCLQADSDYRFGDVVRSVFRS